MDNPVSPAPIPPKPPISLNLAFLLITLISLFLSVFFIYQNWRLIQKLDALIKTQLQPTPTPSVANPSLAETPPVDATSSWKTYTNSAGYSIKYPSTLKTQLIAAGSKADEEANATSRQFVIYKIGSINPYDERYIDFATTQLEPSYDNRMVTQTTLNGYPVKKISFPNIQFEAYSIKTPKGEFIEIYVSKDPTKTTLANQILSTFKFTKENLLDSIFSVTPPDPFRLMRSTENIASYGFDTVEYLVVTNIPTIKLQALRSSTECSKLTAGQYCLYSEGTGQTKDIADVTVGGIPAKSFYISGGNDNAYHVVQTTQAPILEFKMFIAGGGLDQRFHDFLASVKFL